MPNRNREKKTWKRKWSIPMWRRAESKTRAILRGTKQWKRNQWETSSATETTRKKRETNCVIYLRQQNYFYFVHESQLCKRKEIKVLRALLVVSGEEKQQNVFSHNFIISMWNILWIVRCRWSQCIESTERSTNETENSFYSLALFLSECLSRRKKAENKLKKRIVFCFVFCVLSWSCLLRIRMSTANMAERSAHEQVVISLFLFSAFSFVAKIFFPLHFTKNTKRKKKEKTKNEIKWKRNETNKKKSFARLP